MKAKHLMHLAAADLTAARGRAAIAAIGIAMGISVLMVIIGLGLGVRELVLKEVVRQLPVDTIEVIPKTLNLGLFELDSAGLLGGRGLNPDTVERLAHLPGVRAALPKLDVHVPMGARGGARLFGHALYSDVFMMGVPEELVKDEVGPGFVPQAGYIPVVVSDQLLDIYNSSVAPAVGTPRLTAQTLKGFEFELDFGRSLMMGAKGASKSGEERARLLGVSRYAMRLGVTVPIDTARRILNEYGPAGVDHERYSAIVLKAESPSAVPAIIRSVEAMGLAVDQSAKRAGNVLLAATLLAAFVGLLVLALAGLNIAHSFYAQLSERQRELAILRAVGASRRDLVLIVLAQALLLGTIGGLCGIAGALGVAALLDWCVRTFLAEFPFMPSSFFVLPVWLCLCGLAAAALACALGALAPALRAARASVARGLS